MHRPLVSVVVPTYRRPQRLAMCLEALRAQSLGADAFEIVVVDDGSPTPVTLPAWSAEGGVPIRLVRQANAGPAAARNRGVAESRGSLIAFTDDDCLPAATWLERLVAAHEEHPTALVGGTSINGLVDDLFATSSQLIVDMVYDHFNRRRDGSAYFLTSNNILCQRSAYLALGGFDTSYPRAGAEDRDFCDRWRNSGRGLYWVEQALLEHRHSQSLAAFATLHYRYGRGAYRYHAQRRQRRSGTMHDDLGFHGSMLRLLTRHLGRIPGGFRRAQIVACLGLWQCSNALGFLVEAIAERFAPKPERPV